MGSELITGRGRLLDLKDVDCRNIVVASRYKDPRDPKYGSPETYWVNDLANPLQQRLLVHETRTIRACGARTTADTKIKLNGWDDSVLRRVDSVIKTYDITWTALAQMVVDGSTAVYKMKNLKEHVAQGNEALVQRRLQLMEAGRNISRAILIDKDDEEFERQTVSIAEYPVAIDKISKRVCSAAEMPEMLLFGQSPSGLAASGDNEMRGYYDRVQHFQANHLAFAINKIDEILAGEIGIADILNYELKFNPLWKMSDSEDADYDIKRSTAICNYIGAGVFAPEAVQEQVAKELSLNIDETSLPGYLAPKPEAEKAPKIEPQKPETELIKNA
jgi:uncharacterized protein